MLVFTLDDVIFWVVVGLLSVAAIMFFIVTMIQEFIHNKNKKD